ncbi:MAG: T9SS type A sorting domain-containing protein [Bacteroidetes bacterium]|nr:T9SS type A sorting domain-containing protein [Bacteroidota bacterium]
MQRILLFTAIFLATISVNAQKVTTWAGAAKTSGNTSNGATTSNVKFNKPYGMAYDKDSNIWITQEGSHIISMYNKSDQKFYVRSGALNTAGYVNASGVSSRYSSPKGIAVGSKIYIVDAGNHCVRQLDLFTGLGNVQSATLLAGNPGKTGSTNGTGNGASFNYPVDVVVDSKGNVYVSDQQNHVIRKITSAGVVTTYAGQMGTSGSANGDKDAKALFNWPTGLAIDANDNIYVGDVSNSKVRKIEASTGNVSTVYKSGLWTPNDVLVNKNGVVIVSNGCQILGLDPNNTSDTLKAGSSATLCGFKNDNDTNARFNEVKAMLQLSNLFYLAVDQNNHVIRMIEVDPCDNFNAGITHKTPLTFCQGDSVVLTGSSQYTNAWTWTGGSSTDASITAKTAGDYNLKVTDSKTGCSKTDKVTVAVNALPTPSIATPNGTEFCPGASIKLDADQNYAAYKWSSGGSSKSETLKSTSSVTLEVTDANGCKGISSPVSVTEYQVDSIQINIQDNKTNWCEGDEVKLTADGGYTNYKWNFGGTTAEITVLFASDFSVSADDKNGCRSTSKTVTLTFEKLPAKPDIDFIADSIFTTATADDFIWYFNDDEQAAHRGKAYVSDPATGNWHVAVVNAAGCVSEKSDEVVVGPISIVEIEKGLSIYPNPASDVLHIQLTEVYTEETELVILNSLGATVFREKAFLGTQLLSISSLEPGVYFVMVDNRVGRFLVEF